ncbi:potassium channel family protein [Candidatus Lucifugimonas marina]|uniref:Potassium channel protein n=1 Tax=Candidatus Lucifugimonas marina TaxID=3038979 RepID=A0AAJ6CUH4_9CHLR|nr:potassium channel protein [SAR202 cluster bacterium JH702]MDG0869244.1 potassium channel protein [SAR202 cluster bacterium JH639]WFG36648.1 potassium channel protein [SAR202 cluster bacterium JH545]WFG40582.1 potassium channel protein [SAR202 cluster bacterium JH1073]
MMPRNRTHTSQSVALLRRLRIIVPVFMLVIGTGTIGYLLLENDFGVVDAFYQSVITVSTVGFGEVQTLSDASRLFTIVLILLGVSAFTFTFSILGEYVVAGEFRGSVRARKMRNKISSLNGHTIVCGYGRIGNRIAQEFRSVDQPIVVIDNDSEVTEQMKNNGWLVVDGDAGDDQALIDANIENASRLIAATGSDATNLMISLSARTLNPEIFIVSRADDESNEQKLLKAGANRVVPIYRSTGRRMAQLALRPNAVEFTDIALGDQEIELSIEDLIVEVGSALDGESLEKCITPEGANYMVIAVRRKNGALEMMPPTSTILSANDVIVVFGTRDQFSELESLTVSKIS